MRTRLRRYPLIIAAVLWSIWLFDVGTRGPLDRAGKVKGTDFLQFYVAGSFVRDGRTDRLYDARSMYDQAQAVAPGGRDMLYVPIQSPQTALGFAPLTAYSYPIAWLVWAAILTACYAAACWLLWRRCVPLRAYPVETAACCAAFPAFYSTMLHGQVSSVALLFVTIAIAAFGRGGRLTAGLALGCLVFKPHWVLAATAVFTLAREWRVVAGVALAAATQVAATFVVAGSSVMAAYWRTLRSVQQIGDLLEPRPSISLRGLSTVLVTPETAALAVYGCAALLTAIVAARIWRDAVRFEIRMSAMMLAMILVSPHVLEYDLLLLAPVCFLLTAWVVESPADPSRRVVAVSLAVLSCAPILTPVPAPLRLPISVGAMLAVVATLAFTVLENSGAPAPVRWPPASAGLDRAAPAARNAGPRTPAAIREL